jgi:Fur family transcriptional regulator, zinc uptake regulator
MTLLPAPHDSNEQYLDQVATRCRERGVQLTAIRREVLGLLHRSPNGLKAYDLLARVREERSNATPPTVYRALDFLIEQGLAHKIGRINQFVACHHDSHNLPSLFLVCPQCGKVSELSDQTLMAALLSSLDAAGHRLVSPEVEISALCPACARA